jgi:uncharacterized membrane protein
MPEKRSKYDTDPLDPEVARKTEEVWGGETRLMPDPTTGQVGGDGETRRIDHAAPRATPRRAVEPEAPTQRIDGSIPQSYPSVFVPPPYEPPPAPTYAAPRAPRAGQNFQPPAFPPQAFPHAPQRTVSGLGIPERFATTLAYAPFYIGLIVSIIELLVTPRAEARTRFHAAQGLALHLVLIGVDIVFRFAGVLGSGARFGAFLIWMASFVFLCVSMFRVWNGREHRLAPLADATRFLDERIDPRK